VLLSAPFAVSQNGLAEQISSQTKEFFHTFSSGGEKSQVITSVEVADSPSVKSIAPMVRPENVCLSLGEYSSSQDWVLGSQGTSIKNLGESNQEIEFFVFCETASKLRQGAQFFPEEKINSSFISHCPQLTPDNGELACVVILANAVPSAPNDFSVAYYLFFLFAIIVILPMLFLFGSKNVNMKLFNLIKIVFLILLFVVFYFIGIIFSSVTTVLLLFFFFVQINLSIAPLVLGLHVNESSMIKLISKAILVLETVGLIVSLILIAPLL